MKTEDSAVLTISAGLIQSLLDACESLDQTQHGELVGHASALRQQIEQQGTSGAASQVWAAFERVETWDRGSATSLAQRRDAAAEIRATLAAASSPGDVVLELLRNVVLVAGLDDEREALRYNGPLEGYSVHDAELPEFKDEIRIPSSLWPKPSDDLTEYQEARYEDARKVFEEIALAGPKGLEWRSLCRHLGTSQRAAVLSILRAVPEVDVARVSNEEGGRPYSIVVRTYPGCSRPGQR